jgi:hypothetical protein
VFLDLMGLPSEEMGFFLLLKKKSSASTNMASA